MGDAKVFPLSQQERKPDDLVDFYRRARAELGDKAAYWAFQHAKAVGRREIADRKLKRLEARLSHVEYRAASMPSDVAQAMVMEQAPGDLEFHRAETALADAMEQVQATAHVLERTTKETKK